MNRTNYYTGANEQFISEAEAVQNASFGQYAAQMQQQNPTYGLGGNAYMQQYPQQNGYYQNPYMTQPVMNMGYGGQPNPVLQPGYNNQVNPGFQMGYSQQSYPQQMYQQYQSQYEQPQQMFIPPINFAGTEYLLPSNFEEIATEMIMKHVEAEAEWNAQQIANRSRNQMQGMFNPFRQNYYDQPMYGYYNTFQSPVYKELEEIKEKAKQSRKDLNIQLSKLAHNYLNDGVTDEQIEELYSGKYVDVQTTVYRNADQDAFQARFTSQNIVYTDPAAPYREAFFKVKNKIESIMPPDTPYEEVGARMNILMSEWELEELDQKRRTYANSYTSSNNTYKNIVIRKYAEKKLDDLGIKFRDNIMPMQTFKQAQKSQAASREELTQKAKDLANMFNLGDFADCIEGVDENGMLEIGIKLPQNVGSNAGEEVSVNSEEFQYERQREKFHNFVNSVKNKTATTEEKKIQQEDQFDKFMYEMTHPPKSGLNLNKDSPPIPNDG